jgi:hypothetical protein
VEDKKSKMATANRLTVLHKIKHNRGVLSGTFLNDLTKQTKCEKLKEVSELVDSLGLPMAVNFPHSVVRLVKVGISE